MSTENQANSESSNSPFFMDPHGEVSSSDELTLFTVIPCEKHGYHIVMWTPEIDPE